MSTADILIKTYKEIYKQQLLDVWERSVLATHDFLDRGDFDEIKQLVQTIDFNAFLVYCLVENERVLGFVGVADRKIEMLFLDPEIFGSGYGKKLTEFAIRDLQANHVDVNEQNLKAVNFYKKLGFQTYQRTDVDDQGKPYPLLRMKLADG